MSCEASQTIGRTRGTLGYREIGLFADHVDGILFFFDFLSKIYTISSDWECFNFINDGEYSWATSQKKYRLTSRMIRVDNSRYERLEYFCFFLSCSERVSTRMRQWICRLSSLCRWKGSWYNRSKKRRDDPHWSGDTISKISQWNTELGQYLQKSTSFFLWVYRYRDSIYQLSRTSCSKSWSFCISSTRDTSWLCASSRTVSHTSRETPLTRWAMTTKSPDRSDKKPRNISCR